MEKKMNAYLRISQLKKTAIQAASRYSVLKHSFKVITCYSAIALVSLAMPARVKADPPGAPTDWTKSFEDTFDNSFDSNKWVKTFWWGDGNINDGSVSYYSPNNVSVSDGYLTLEANNNSEGGRSYTGAVVQSFGKFYQTYGYFEARIKVPKGGGIAPYFSLSPEDESWPPEVNIAEIPGAVGDNATTVWMTNHYIDGNGNVSIDNGEGTWTSSSGLDQDYHTYGLLWQPGLLVWYVDGVEHYRTTVGVPDKDCYIVLGLGVYDDNGSWTGHPDNTTFPQYMSVDWVRAWKKSGD
jgi:beta-glucanase (GH16 family)